MPQEYKVKVLSVKDLGDGFWSGKLERPEGFEYIAGQYVSILVDRVSRQRRSYSLASYPDLDYLELAVDTAPMGVGSRFLLSLKAGDEVEILGPLGRFTVQDSTKNKTFLGTGCGVVPLRSQIHDLLKNREFKERVELQWGMRHERDVFWKPEFEQLEKEFPNFHFDLVLSKPGADWAGCKGHLQDCLIKHGLDLSGWEAYLCGNSEMINDMADRLVSNGVKSEEVYQEKFS